MPNFKGGPKEAAKMLQALGVGASRKLLEEIRQKDPQMAELLENQLYSLEDLRALTPAMMRDFLQGVKLEELGIALRTYDRSLADSIFEKVSSGMKADIQDGLNGKPRKVSEVEEIQSRLLDHLKLLIDQGKVVISHDDEYV